MKKLYRLFLVISIAFSTFFNAFAHEHAMLKGTVTDSVSGEGISSASIMLNGVAQGTTADALGNFRFTKLTPVTYKISVSALSFTTKTATVFIMAQSITPVFLFLELTIKRLPAA